MRESESRWDSMVQTIDEETQLETKTWALLTRRIQLTKYLLQNKKMQRVQATI